MKQCVKCAHFCPNDDDFCPLCGAGTILLAENQSELDKAGLRELPVDYNEWLAEPVEALCPEDVFPRPVPAPAPRPDPLKPPIPEPEEPDPETQEKIRLQRQRFQKMRRHRERVNPSQFRFVMSLICLIGSAAGAALTWNLIGDVFPGLAFVFFALLLTMTLITRQFSNVFPFVVGVTLLELMLFGGSVLLFHMSWDFVGMALSDLWLFMFCTGCRLFVKC